MEYGNLAVKEEYRTYKRRKPQKKVNNVKMRNSKRMLDRSIAIRRMFAVVVVSVSAGFMISQFIGVNDARQELTALQSELADQEALTSRKVFELEKSVDLDEIEKIATTRLGMQRPESHQTIYLNVKGSDVTEKTAGEVEGAGNRIAAFFKSIGSNIVSAFSIK